MKKEDYNNSVNRVALFYIIFGLFFAGVLVIVRAYFLNQPVTPVFIDNTIKYNQPLELTNLPTFNTTTNLNIFPSGKYQSASNSQVQWLSLKTSTGIQIAYIDNSLLLNQIYFLPNGSTDIKIYDNQKIFFIFGAENGNGPKLIFKDKNNSVEVIQLKATEYFTGYTYSPEEELFYISKGNSDGIFTLFTLSRNGESNIILQLNSKFSIIQSETDFSYIKISNKCQTLTYSTKLLKDFDCNNIFLNKSRLNIIAEPGKIILNNNGSSKLLFQSTEDQLISNWNYQEGKIYFVLFSQNSNGGYFANSINYVDINAKTELVSDIMPNGSIKFVFELDNNLFAVEKYQGIEKIILFDKDHPTSYTVDNWTELQFSLDNYIDIEPLGEVYTQ